jgi:hypothetical protein
VAPTAPRVEREEAFKEMTLAGGIYFAIECGKEKILDVCGTWYGRLRKPKLLLSRPALSPGAIHAAAALRA